MGLVNAIDGQIVTLTCEVEAIPKPTVTWYKDEAPLSSYEDEVMYLDNNATVRWVCYTSVVLETYTIQGHKAVGWYYGREAEQKKFEL